MLNKSHVSESPAHAHMAGNVSYVQQSDEKWIVDTGATNHMVGNQNALHDKVTIGNAGSV